MIDVVIVFLGVHGGSFHKLFRLQQALREAGLSCLVHLGTDPTRGLQVGIDLDEADIERLAKDGIFVGPRREIRRRLADEPARLYLFDSFRDPDVAELIDLVRRAHRAKTGQIGSLLEDFHCSGADYLFVQHPLTLWFDIEYSKTRSSRLLPEAKRIFFAGNIFYEPVVNVWTSELRDRAQFCAKYGFDPTRPTAFWLPDRMDALDQSYAGIVSAVRAAGMNLAVKMHPWEYKFLKHGFDPEKKGRTSAEIFGVTAIEERDASWAYKYCDFGIVRGSSAGMELALWGKPVVSMPSGREFRRLDRIQNELVSECVMRIQGPDDLPGLLARGGPGEVPAENYARVRERILLDPGRDSFAQHVEVIREILERPEPRAALGWLGVRRMYLGRVPLSWVNVWHRPLHVLARLLHGSAPANETFT